LRGGGYISEAVDNEGFYEREFYIKEDGGNKLCSVYFFPHCGAVGLPYRCKATDPSFDAVGGCGES
jgi:hypothetical protein